MADITTVEPDGNHLVGGGIVYRKYRDFRLVGEKCKDYALGEPITSRDIAFAVDHKQWQAQINEESMTIRIKGELEIDSYRGVIYFHDDQGVSRLRLSRLPKPIPNPQERRLDGGLLDLGVDPETGVLRASWPDLSQEKPNEANR